MMVQSIEVVLLAIHVLVNNDYLVCTVRSCPESFVYNDTVDYDCILVSTIVLIKMTV